LCATFTFTTIVTLDYPIFSSTTPVTVTINKQNPGTLTLPVYSDPLGLPLTLSTYETGQAVLPSLASISGNTYSLTATSFSELGTYSIDAKICNTIPLCTTYIFFVVFTNTAPAFGTPSATSVSVSMMGTGYLTLPVYNDAESDPITLMNTLASGGALPLFIAFTAPTFTVTPNQAYHVGSFSVTTHICDGEPACNSFTFTVTVTGTAPYFQ